MAAIGYVLSSEQFTTPQLISFGARAERSGFDMVWTSDHFHPWQSNQGHSGHAWVMLAALGQQLRDIPMGTGVTCPTYRYHPAIVAQAFATLGMLYPGRVFLGLGTGEALNEQAATGEWGDYGERAARLVEAVQLIRRLWSGEWVQHRGQYYHVPGAKLYDLPSQPIPIYMAASGEESAGHAGRHGDGWITDGESLKDDTIRGAFEEAARRAGKDPKAMPIIVELFVHVGTEDDAKQHAAKLWRFLPKAWTKYVDNPDPRAILEQANAEVSLDEVVKMWSVSPDPQAHIEKIQALMKAGATHIFIHSGQEQQIDIIEFFAREVLPQMQHTRMTL